MKAYTQTDQQLHFLSQIIAKANRTYVSKKDDDSHTNLCFDTLGKSITGHWIKVGEEKILFTLNLDTQTIEILDKSRNIVFSVDTISKHIKEVEQEIEDVLPKLGLEPKGFAEDLHFEIPHYDFAENPIGKIDKEGLKQWIIYRNLANQTSLKLLEYTQTWEEIRIWPHHFDTGIYVVLKENLGLGFGLAMEDKMAGAPYFYLAGYGLKSEISYNNLPQSAHWQWKTDDNWKGVILTLATLSNYAEKQQQDIINNYLLQNLQWYLNK